MNSDTVCSGSAPIVSNNSIGYDSYSWIIDGQYISSDIQPVLPHLTPGNHTIILEGTSGVNIDQFSRDLYVQVFSAIPSLSLSEPLCWAGDTVEIYATTNAPTLAYDWYLQTSTDTIQQASGGAILSVETSSFALSYFAVPVSHSGCRGMASEPMVIVASDNIPYVSAPNGTANICTWGQPLTSTYTTDPLIGATDITDYVWTLNPLVAGVMVTNGASCTISWDPNFDGNAILSCSGVDACGVGPASTAYMFVDTGNYITEQPTDIVVDVGDPLTLSIELAGPLLNNGTWFRNGIQAVSANTYTYNTATSELAGEYYWRGNAQGQCGFFYSDTITVTILGPSGTPEQIDREVAVYPNPFISVITVEVPTSATDTKLTLHDVAGRCIIDVSLPPGDNGRLTFEMEELPAGVYIIGLNNGNWFAHSSLVKL